MTSLLTNAAALGALQTLRIIDRNMEETQGNISSGKRVMDASDNAAYWSIATTMKSDQSAMSTVIDALGLAAAKTDTTYAGLNQTMELVKKIKDKLVTASEPGVDKDKVGSEIEQLKAQLGSVAQSASFSGENWLYNTGGDPGTKSMVGALTRSANGQIGIQTINFDTKDSVMIDKADARRGLLTNRNAIADTAGTTCYYYLFNCSSTINCATATVNGVGVNLTTTEVKVNSTSTADQLRMMLTVVDGILSKITNVAADLGAVKSRIESQNDFVKDLLAVIDKGVGNLVDADMNEASTRLKALQTQQQLGIQSLSIANSNASNIMQLFRNG